MANAKFAILYLYDEIVYDDKSIKCHNGGKMRKNINLLLSCVLSMGISSVFGASELATERAGHESGSAVAVSRPVSNVARAFMSLEQRFSSKYGVEFADHELRAKVRFTRGLTRYLDKDKAVAALIKAVHDKDHPPTDDVLAMLKKIIQVGDDAAVADDDFRAEEVASHVSGLTGVDDDEENDIVREQLTRDIMRATSDIRHLEEKAEALREEMRYLNLESMREVLIARRERIAECEARMVPFREKEHGEKNANYQVAKRKYDAGIPEAARAHERISAEVEKLSGVLSGLEGLHTVKLRELEGVTHQKRSLADSLAAMERELAELAAPSVLGDDAAEGSDHDAE
jgi:hypothetical protein